MGNAQKYLSYFLSGGESPPSGDVIKEWLNIYKITRSKFTDVIAMDRNLYTRIILPSDHPDYLPMPYSCIKLFYIWSGDLEIVTRFNDADYFISLPDKLNKYSRTIHDLCQSLNLNRAHFYHLAKNDPSFLIPKIDDYLSTLKK